MGIAVVNLLASPSGLMFPSNQPKKLSALDFQREVNAGNVRTIHWQQLDLSGELKNDKKFTVEGYGDPNAQGAIGKRGEWINSGIDVKVEPAPASQGMLQIIGYILTPLLVGVIFWFFISRAAQASGNQAMNFGRSRARRAGEHGPKVTFEDVAGIDEAKAELYEIVDFLRNTKKYVALGAKIPKGILLTGPPGVGKTHLARAIAGEAGVPFFHISGSDFVEMFVGVGAARVRDLFETAKAHRPCLIFVDEIDAVGRQRGAGLGGGHDEREQTLNQLLVEMDGFDPNTGVILIAATNRPDVLDPALLRPGRFDRQIVVDAPDAPGREAILKIHAKGKPLDGTVDLGVIAKRTPGFTGADLANALNESALLAARNNKTKVGMDEIEESLDRVMVGPARRNRKLIQKDRELTAYHEAGHAIVGELLEHCDPIHKVTILPRGMALGITWSLPEIEKYSVSRSELMDDIAMSLGGLVAEEVVFGERWTGASSDLVQVTRIARAMVCEFGMSERLGTLAIGRRSRNPFLGRDYAEDRDYSEDVAKLIDEEVRHIVDTCRQRAQDILTQRRDTMDTLVEALMERETLSREEFLAIMAGEPLPEPKVKAELPAEPVSETDRPAPSVPPRLEPGTA
ncbi:MAG: ATP-dependent zinc metalloprotease FtsH [Armatimonadetes bacterium]|nr:ATP-dependent zinc metalloprotease FtsH [Armatimonadota bacterium]